jgi:hypothetical protein
VKNAAGANARLLADQQRHHLAYVRLESRVGKQLDTPLLALQQIPVGPHVHDLVELADFGPVVAD